MSVYLLLKRGRSNIVVNVTESMQVIELKKLVNQLWGEEINTIYLFNGEGARMENESTLAECGITANLATNSFPYTINVSLFRDYENMARESHLLLGSSISIGQKQKGKLPPNTK
nr:uncharacterized protein LOC106683174 isoform X2 [Halyomorpha halys]